MSEQTQAPSREPYQLGSPGGPVAVLLHGLTGSPYDLRPLAEGLAELGCSVSAPRLAGHENPESLSRASWREWYASAEAALDQARREGEPALLLGFSLGSLLSLRLAALRPDWLAGLVVMGVPIAQPGWQRAAVRLLSSLRRSSPQLAARIGYHARGRSDVRSELLAQRLKHGFADMPYESIAQLCELQDEVWPLLPEVRAPTLMLHGRYDHSAPVEGSARVSQALGSSSLRRVVLPRSYHHVARDLDADLARNEVTQFAKQVLF